MDKEAFKIAVPDSVLGDLRERLGRVRYPIDFANETWAYGTNRAYLEEILHIGGISTIGASMKPKLIVSRTIGQ